jgi:hypothetical protein
MVHRLLFVIGTIVLGIAGSLVATDVRSAGNWTMLVGAAAVMYGADVFADVERVAQRLAASSGHREEKTRGDVLKWHAPRGTFVIFAAGAIAIAVGLTLKATNVWEHRPSQTRDPRTSCVPRGKSVERKTSGHRLLTCI